MNIASEIISKLLSEQIKMPKKEIKTKRRKYRNVKYENGI